MFHVWSDEIFNPFSLRDMHHHRFTYLLLTDSSSWQGRWQLTYINPATQHKLSLQSRNPSLLFKHRGAVSVGAGYQMQGAPALKSRHWSWALVAPARPAAAPVWSTQHQGYMQGPLCSCHWPGHILMEENERQGWTKVTCVGAGGVGGWKALLELC